MSKKAIVSSNAPKPASFFSQAILSSSKYQLELSGQIGLVSETMTLIGDSVEAQTKQAFENIEAVLKEIGWDLSNITKVRVYLTAMTDYKEMNDVYATKFSQNAPARVAVAVKELPLGAKVEIECIAQGDEIIE